MKRSGFKSKLAPRPAKQWEGRLAERTVEPRRSRITSAITMACPPIAKHDYVRSEAMRLAYRLIPCQWDGCGVSDGTVCCAHSNFAEHGKGGGIKADDNRGAALCFKHHSALDQGSEMTYDERRTGFQRAHERSVGLIVELGHWPYGVIVPDLTK